MIPSCLREATKIGVTIICENGKKCDHVYIETDNLLGVSRIINTYKPKRGYWVLEINIKEVVVMESVFS